MLKKMKKNNRQKVTNAIETDKFIHKKSLGQNFLTSAVVPNWMCEAGDVKAGDTVLEIGPGTGVLTGVLLEKGAKVIAVEADDRAIEALNNTFSTEIKAKELTIHHQDARETDFRALGLETEKFKIVANIPYYLSGFLLRLFLDNETQPSSITFLIQKELAYRIARDKKESLLSLSVKAFGDPIYVKTVSRGHFQPKPKVDSAILSIHNINQTNFQNIDQETFFTNLHLGLGNKRKQLLGNLSQKYPKNELIKIFEKLDLTKTVRGEDLPLSVWLKLSHSLENLPQLPPT